MVRETPELYEQVVKPYIAGLPASRLQWYPLSDGIRSPSLYC